MKYVDLVEQTNFNSILKECFEELQEGTAEAYQALIDAAGKENNEKEAGTILQSLLDGLDEKSMSELQEELKSMRKLSRALDQQLKDGKIKKENKQLVETVIAFFTNVHEVYDEIASGKESQENAKNLVLDRLAQKGFKKALPKTGGDEKSGMAGLRNQKSNTASIAF